MLMDEELLTDKVLRNLASGIRREMSRIELRFSDFVWSEVCAGAAVE